jgi:hypothetical protein
MNYKEIAWAALIAYYAGGGNKDRYVELFKNKGLIGNLRHNPSLVPFKNFKDKVISGFINSWGRMRLQDNTAQQIYNAIIILHNSTSQILNDTLKTCNLSTGSTVCNVTAEIYDRLTGIRGVSMTGFSKIAHILNDSLFPMIDISIRKEYEKVYDISLSAKGYINWMREMQRQARDVVVDFQKQGITGSPEIFLSQTLGFTSVGCTKSLAKFLDEYYWLTVTNGTPIPPKWLP